MVLRHVLGLSRVSRRLKSTLPQFTSLKVSRRGSGSQVALVELNRPDTFNTLCPQMMKELAEVVEQFEGDSSIRCLVFTGSVRVFSGKITVVKVQRN